MTDFSIAQTDLQQAFNHFSLIPFRRCSDIFSFFFFSGPSFFYSRVPSYVQASVVIQFVTQTEVLITSFRLICTFRGEQQAATIQAPKILEHVYV